MNTKRKQPQLTDAERKLLALGVDTLWLELSSDGPQMKPVCDELSALLRKLECPATQFTRRHVVLLTEACGAGRRALEEALSRKRDHSKEARTVIDMWLHFDVIRERLESHLPNKKKHA